MTWTAAIIVSAKRADLVFDEILPAVLATSPDQVLLVGDVPNSTEELGAVVERHRVSWTALPPDFQERIVPCASLYVPPMTRSTNDALVKRDVAALACTSDWIAYFSDDHKPAPDFGKQMQHLNGGCDVYVPARYAGQPGEHYGERLNNGEASEYIPNVDTAIGHYCGGHAGVYRLSLIQRMPWTAGPHHREWDLLQSRRHMEAGAKYCWTDQLKVFDVEPGATPWN